METRRRTFPSGGPNPTKIPNSSLLRRTANIATAVPLSPMYFDLDASESRAQMLLCLLHLVCQRCCRHRRHHFQNASYSTTNIMHITASPIFRLIPLFTTARNTLLANTSFSLSRRAERKIFPSFRTAVLTSFFFVSSSNIGQIWQSTSEHVLRGPVLLFQRPVVSSPRSGLTGSESISRR